MKKILLLLFLVTTSTYAQQDAWVYFTDKENVQTSIDNPISILTQEAIDRKAMHNTPIDERDVPVNEDYISEIKNQDGIAVLAKSKWFNCVHVRGSLENIQNLLDLSFVSSIEYADRSRNRNPDNFYFQKEAPEQRVDFTYGTTENQVTMLSVDEVHLQDYTGEGMIVAIMDSGFSGVDTQDGFARIRDNGKLLGGYDFVSKTEDVFAFQGSDHGTRVVSNIAGFVQNQFVGTGPDAAIYCFRTEDVASENPVEESNWVEAAERADSLGVDIINTSLGYRNYDFDPYDLTYEDMDGETAFISRGTTIAFEKGMLVVTSAGNSGSGMISAPADAVGALTVGAVDSEGNYASFSSIGPSSDGRVKPDVMAKGASAAVIRSNGTITTSSGTSFSSPIMAGAVASIWQANPNLTNAELMQFIREVSSTFDNPTPQFGYGIPDFGALLETLLSVDDSAFAKAYTLQPIPTSDRFQVGLPEGVNEASLRLFNIIGQEVHREFIKNDNQWVDISELKLGIYLARLESTNLSSTIKIIKK
ncbi:T9SS C-terminal target domain-containing protein [Dokdonia sinensis]|uniref:T9SS C-terminal target domain-containing protein n=1 Tax=Dokdonia sinensis TaxID=2479847 RepID=A0A3M0GMJ0_9FLAO|nr:S8 family serine peptidase [Dokdonia sinensis]RMB63932.1 T9SS C-terminal target domain-containing protein [Dokdonia sinensis]